MGTREISRTDGTDLTFLEKDVKNKFKWTWLEEKDSNSMFLSDWVRKVNIGGKVMCILCNDLVSYASGGKKDLKRHTNKQKHKDIIKLRKTNSTLPSNLTPSSVEKECTVPYGAPPNVHDESVCSSRKELSLPTIVSAEDRKAHSEAYIISFIAEHSLPFTMAPHLITFAQTLSSDAKTLQKLSMSRVTASYKLKEGLAAVIKEELVSDLRTTYFSLNVDECMSNNYEKVFSILVSYYSEVQKSIVVQHYKSKSFAVVNAKNLCRFVLDSFSADEIPLKNLVSNLSDSTNYMRGKVSGFETLLRKAVPHLLDIDGDVCHHAHNATGKFLKPFDGRIENLLKDLRTEMTWSTDLREYLKEICEILGINFRMPANFVRHRWLSALDAADNDFPLVPALRLIYYAWVDKDLKETYKDDFDQILKDASAKSKARVKTIDRSCEKKSLTVLGMKRKKRIVKNLFYEAVVTDLHMNFYISVLPLIKSFVLIFEQKTPMIHRLFDELKSCLSTFLASFVKVEKIVGLTGKQLLDFNVTNTLHHKKFSEWNIGRNCQNILKKLKSDDPIRRDFKSTVKEAYISAAIYIQKKFPLNNNLLKYLSAIDPKCHGVSSSASAMKKLVTFFPNVIDDSEREQYDADVDRYQLSVDLPDVFRSDGSTPQSLDEWWSAVLKDDKFPFLGRLVKAAMSIFTGPMIEQSFSGMNDIVSAKTNKLSIDTFAAIQSVKYDLRASNQTSHTRFRRRNYLRSPVNKRLCSKMMSAWGAYNDKLKVNRKRKLKKHVDMEIQPKKLKKKQTMHERAEDVRKRIFKKKSSRN